MNPPQDAPGKKGKEKVKDSKKGTLPLAVQTRSTAQRSPVKKKDAPKPEGKGG